MRATQSNKFELATYSVYCTELGYLLIDFYIPISLVIIILNIFFYKSVYIYVNTFVYMRDSTLCNVDKSVV